MKSRYLSLSLAGFCVAAPTVMSVSCAMQKVPVAPAIEDTSTPTPTFSVTQTPTLTPTPTRTPTRTPTGTLTPSATPTQTYTMTNTPTLTWTRTPTFTPTGTLTPFSNALPRPNHVVIVLEENQGITVILGPGASVTAPFINNTLAAGGAVMTNYFAITSGSMPNYLAIFSGSTQGVTGDVCPDDFGGIPNLGNSLLTGGYSFAGYSQDLPSAGATVCTSGTTDYVRKHNPWVDFQVNGNIPAGDNLPFTSFPTGTDYSSLPTVSFVVPNELEDMHSAPVSQGDAWLQANMNGYVTWCQNPANNSLFILTFDEDEGSGAEGEHIATIFYGAMVCKGQYPEPAAINHYNLCRTLTDMYGLAALNNAVTAPAITDIFACYTPVPTPTP